MSLFLRLVFLYLMIVTNALSDDYTVVNLVNDAKVRMENTKKFLDSSSIDDIESVKQQLQIMYNDDQEVRANLLQYNNYPIVVNFIDHQNRSFTDHLKKILWQHGGWVPISKFGYDADKHALAIVQNSDHDPYFQAGIAFLLEQLKDLNETDKKNFAYLYDRMAVKLKALGINQKYGTQFEIIDGQLKILPCNGTVDEINQRRTEMGMESLDDYIKNLVAVYK